MVFPNIHVLPLFFEYNYALMFSFKDNGGSWRQYERVADRPTQYLHF